MPDNGAEAGFKGVVEDVKGKAKEVAGRVTDNDRLEKEGQAQQDKATADREVAEHEGKAEAARARAEAEEAKQRAAQKS
ncbi:MAG: microaggregate-binding protein 1 [Acidimicrobiales bacterium]